jgi:hypothetical protein
MANNIISMIPISMFAFLLTCFAIMPLISLAAWLLGWFNADKRKHEHGEGGALISGMPQIQVHIDSKDFIGKGIEETKIFFDGLYKIGTRDKQEGEEEMDGGGMK